MTDITIKTQTLPPAYEGLAYEAGIVETGSLTALSGATVSSGSLPPGLALGSDGRITGTPTKQGSYSFKVTLTDTAGGVQSPSLSITVTTGQTAYRDITQAPVSLQYATMWPQ